MLFVLVCAILLGAGVLIFARLHRGVAWVTTHVTVAPRLGPAMTFETRPVDESNRDHVLTVVPAEVRRSTIVEEDPS